MGHRYQLGQQAGTDWCSPCMAVTGLRSLRKQAARQALGGREERDGERKRCCQVLPLGWAPLSRRSIAHAHRSPAGTLGGDSRPGSEHKVSCAGLNRVGSKLSS